MHPAHASAGSQDPGLKWSRQRSRARASPDAPLKQHCSFEPPARKQQRRRSSSLHWAHGSPEQQSQEDEFDSLLPARAQTGPARIRRLASAQHSRTPAPALMQHFTQPSSWQSRHCSPEQPRQASGTPCSQAGSGHPIPLAWQHRDLAVAFCSCAGEWQSRPSARARAARARKMAAERTKLAMRAAAGQRCLLPCRGSHRKSQMA
mmetsp:Transcript_39321/g.112225  ORF Transcript_39321/g.112225 Transcript_39321/m.112225 type:complete len:205 (-) Transcript_39321:3-617(-)